MGARARGAHQCPGGSLRSEPARKTGALMKIAQSWTVSDIAEQAGKRVVITGANSGIGYQAARVLARKGAQVVLACRDPQRAERAVAAIRAETPAADVEVAIV